MRAVSFLGGLVGALLWSLVLALGSVVVLEPVAGPRLLPALTGLLELFGPAAAAATLLSLVEDSSRGTSAARSVVLVAILMGVLGFALHEGLRPSLHQLEQRVRDEQAEAGGDNPGAPSSQDAIPEPDQAPDTAREFAADLDANDGPSLAELVSLAQDAAADRNFYSAWYYYDLALSLAPTRQDLAQRRSEMLARMEQDLERPEDEALRTEMEIKRRARQAQENGDPITAWRLLQAVLRDDPSDPDVTAILPELEADLREQSFSVEDAQDLEERPREGPLVFLQDATVPLLGAGGEQEWIVYIGDIGPNNDRSALFARDIVITSRQNPEIRISADLARVAEDALLFQGLSRTDPGQPGEALAYRASVSGIQDAQSPPLFPIQVDLQRLPILTGTDFYGDRLSLPRLLQLLGSDADEESASLASAGVPTRAVRNSAALRLLMPLQIVLLVLLGAAIGAGGIRNVPLSTFMQALPAVAFFSVLDQALSLGLQAGARLFPSGESLLGVTLGLGAVMLLPLFFALALMVARVSDITALTRR